MREILLPTTQPETEWLLGRAVVKVSPKRGHAVLQLAFAQRLSAWAGTRGDVGTEWRFRVPLDGVLRPIVPDVSYLSAERSQALEGEDYETPPLAPDIAVEIRSNDRHAALLRAKVSDLLRGGAPLVIVVDPDARTIATHDRAGVATFAAGESMRHGSAPGLVVNVDELFGVLHRPRAD